MTKRVLVTSRSFGSISEEPFNILREAGLEIEMMRENFSADSFAASVRQADALIIGGHGFDAELLRQCPRLRIICKHGVGLDNIPLAAAKEMGVPVINVPDANSDTVADLAFGLILALARGIPQSVEAVKRGKSGLYIGAEVWGKTLGLIGFGRIAQRVAARARGFSMRVLAYDPYLKPDSPARELPFAELLDRDAVTAESDFLSLHLPLTSDSEKMVNRAFIEGMKPGSYLINAARGKIVDEAALYDALASGKLAGAALDVLEREPPATDHPLLSLDKVIVTGHIGGYTREALNRVSVTCARGVVDALARDREAVVVDSRN